jgi:hypothetical protein
MKATVLCCLLTLGVTGCFVFGDRFGSGRAVSLKFPPSAGLTANSPQTHEALQITDTVLVQEGLIRAAPSSVPDANGIIAYYHYTPERPTTCEVFLKGDRLNIVFRERYPRHSSGDVKKLCAELAQKFRSHYYPKMVRVVD